MIREPAVAYNRALFITSPIKMRGFRRRSEMSLLLLASLYYLCCIPSVHCNATFPPQTAENRQVDDNPRKLNPHHKSRYYEFLNDNSRTNNTTLMDVWLCLACALGWSCWFLSSMQPPDRLIFETRDSKKIMGHVLQVTLGEDNLGTGIPVYHAVVDYVVEGDVDVEPLQIRKVFSTKRLLAEGFANVEVLVLTDDPTTAILFDDFVELKSDQEKQDAPSIAYLVVAYLVAAILIGTSIVGSVLVILRMEKPLFGWISLGVTAVLLYPTASFINNMISYVCSLAGPLTERPGEIIHGQRMHCTGKRCHALDPCEVFGDDEKEPTIKKFFELSSLQLPSVNHPITGIKQRQGSSTPNCKLFPNAGCGFGAFNVHLPDARPRTGSSVSSMSTSQNSNEKNTMKDRIGVKDTSILEKYEMHVAMEENSNQ